MLQALTVSPGEQTVVYHMPHTEIAVDIHYTREVREAGAYANFAEEMLGVRNAVTKSDTLYTLDRIETGTRTTADPERVYKVTAEAGIDLQLLTLDEKGILNGYNVPYLKPKHHDKKPGRKPQPEQTILPPPLPEEAVNADSPREQAKIVAKQILQLREARTYLLLGESEHQPSDGAAIEVLLRGIEDQERALTALFTGRVRTEHGHKTLYYAPTTSTQVILGRFDEEHGVVSEEEEGDPIILTIETHEQRLTAEAAPAPTKKAKNAPVPSPIYYNLPGKAHYQLRVGEEIFVERTIPVAQLGISVPLTRDLLTDKTHIQLNHKTGNIESIQKK